MSIELITMIEIITEKEAWNNLIDSCPHSDFYHTYDYHMSSKNENEEAILIKYSDNENSVVLPLLIRNIEGTQYKDATSVYGYPGPLITDNYLNIDILDFKKELQKLFLEMHIVSVFSRLNPFIPCQEDILEGLGAIVTAGNVVYIDLTEKLDDQERAYQKRLRTYINKARRLCTVKKAVTEEEVLKFIDMYYENMHRVNAKEKYFFEKAYFFELFKSTHFKTEILLTTLNETDEIISGAMFIKKGDIVQYHLSGTKEQFIRLNPVKLMIDEMRVIATGEKYSYFNLGGGVSSNEDSLFKFKSNFSRNFKKFKVWKYIVNLEAYGELIQEKERACSNPHGSCSKFFPCYRCEN